MINYTFLLKIKYKNSILLFVISILVILIVLLSFLIKTYTSYSLLAIYDEYLVVSVPIENSDAVNKGEYLTIDNQKYSYEIKHVSKWQVKDFINYQDYYLKINKSFNKNEVIKVTFFYEKQRIIEKIIAIIF